MNTRPIFDKAMASELAEYIAKVIREWEGDPSAYVDMERLTDIAEDCYDENGYQIAQRLEMGMYIRPDVMLVEELDNVSYQADQIEKAAVMKWVKENNLTLDLSVGRRVVITLAHYKVPNGKITTLYPEEMKYGVRTDDQKETSHYIVKAEHVRVEETQAA